MDDIRLDSPLTDALAPAANDLLALDKAVAYRSLVVRTNGNERAAEALSRLTPAKLLTKPVVSDDHARALLAALWLWHDWLDSSHRISQDIPTPTGSFWHAIMHRREGDFGNAKYWYARCQGHPVFRSLANYANDVLHPLPADKSLLRLTRDGWDPNAFVDLAEQVYNRPEDSRHAVAVILQKLEWRLLFDQCMRAASGQ